jgi:hypothetical protein
MSVGRYFDFSFRFSTDTPFMQNGFGRFEGSSQDGATI